MRFTDNYNILLHRLQAYRSDRGREVSQKRRAVEKLERYVRDFWDVLSRRIVREELSASLHLTYNLPLSGENPNVSSASAWLGYGEDLLRGDELAVRDGYQPMSNPSAADLLEWVARVRTELDDVSDADARFDAEQHEADRRRPKCDEHIRKVSHFMDIALYGMPADDVHHIKTRYGYEYLYESEEEERTLTGKVAAKDDAESVVDESTHSEESVSGAGEDDLPAGEESTV